MSEGSPETPTSSMRRTDLHWRSPCTKWCQGKSSRWPASQAIMKRDGSTIGCLPQLSWRYQVRSRWATLSCKPIPIIPTAPVTAMTTVANNLSYCHRDRDQQVAGGADHPAQEGGDRHADVVGMLPG